MYIYIYTTNRDAHTITICMTGAVIGEATIPMIIGQFMKYSNIGDDIFMKLICIITCLLISIYVVLYSILKYSIFKNYHTK